jgi:CheY-like chemotaxis protein
MGFMLRIDYSRLSFLVIDGDRVSQRILSTMLGAFGARDVAVAGDSSAGIKAAFARRPDIVLMDWGLPRREAREVVASLRSEASPDPAVPIIGLSGDVREGDVTAARDAGITDFLAKPIRAETLHQRIAGVLVRPREFVAAPAYRGPDRRRLPRDGDGQVSRT